MFESLPLWGQCAVFAAGAALVWAAGTRVTRYADIIARRTGLGQAAVGLLVLAAITSLPELAVTLTASARGNAALGLNNLLGSVALHVTLLAAADAMYGRGALTAVIAEPVVLLQMALNVLLLALFAAGASAGDTLVAGVGAWSWTVLAAYVGSAWFLERSRNLRSWVPAGRRPSVPGAHAAAAPEPPLARVLVHTAIAGATILVAGFALARSGEIIARETGLGQGFGGFLLLGFATALPEIVTMFTAARMGRTVMAVSEVFGSNLFTVALVCAADAAFPAAPILERAGPFAVFAALLGIVLTTLFLVGLIERRDRTVARMGIDSLAVLLAYSGGVALLYRMR